MSNHFWQGRNVFITGCTGLLGSWLTAVLIKQGANIVGLIHKNPHKSLLAQMELLDDITIVQGDICDSHLLTHTLASHQIDTIFHLAAQTLVVVANQAPVTTFETNIKGTWLLLDAARHCATVNSMVVAGSDKAYGAQPQLPYHEDAPLLGQHPYDVSKSCADLIARTYAHSFDLPVAVTRCSNLYGGGDLNWNRIVPGTIRSVLNNERPVIRSDGQAKRNYIFVQDAVRGFMMVAEQMGNTAVKGQAFNLGSAQPITVLEMMNTIIKLSGSPKMEPIILNQAKNEIQEQHLCSDKARQVLGWSPQSTLESSLTQTMHWYRDYLTNHN